MGISRGASLHLFLLLLSISWSPQALAQPDQATFTAFTWEGLSLSMTPERMKSALESQGYTPVNVNENEARKKIVALYNRKTATAAGKVQFTAIDGALTKISFSEVRIGGAKNFLSASAADEIFERVKTQLDLEDTACNPGAGGGGTCTGQPASMTHNNSFSVSVNPRSVKIVLNSLPLPQQVVRTNQEIASGLESAYACLGTTDVTSVRDVYDCIQSSSNTLSRLPPHGRDSTHRSIRLDYPTLSCANVADYYKKGLAHVGGDVSAIPSCRTIAAVIERATGNAPYW